MWCKSELSASITDTFDKNVFTEIFIKWKYYLLIFYFVYQGMSLVTPQYFSECINPERHTQPKFSKFRRGNHVIFQYYQSNYTWGCLRALYQGDTCFHRRKDVSSKPDVILSNPGERPELREHYYCSHAEVCVKQRERESHCLSLMITLQV